MTKAVRSLFPHPFLTILLTLIWCLLNNGASLGTVVFGAILGVLIPLGTAAYWPGAPRGLRLGKLTIYGVIVLWDIIVANIEVAWIVIARPNAKMRTHWVVIPLELRTPEAITILAGTITLTPGTVSADMSDEGHYLLVHALDTANPDEVRDDIKHRYERRLKEIFE